MQDNGTIREKALAVKPKILIAGHSAYPRILDFKKFREIADDAVISDPQNATVIEKIASQAKELCSKFPAPGLEHPH